MQKSADTGGIGWGLLGFIFPIVGLILYIVWMDEKPLTARAAGIGALVNVILNVVIAALYFLFVFVMFLSLQ